MAVAKSYQALELVCDPYEVAGRAYVKVLMKNGNIKQVRWYTDREYKRMYGENSPTSTAEKRDLKSVLGFEKGYITLLEGPVENYDEYLRFGCNARYSTLWGWYFISTESLPSDLPEDLKPINLNWEQVSKDNVMYHKDTIRAIADTLIYGTPINGYVGSVDEVIEVQLIVDKAYDFESKYGGYTTMHIMKDAEDRVYIWNTSARHWKAGTVHHIRGRIKEHKTYKGVAQNILTNCREVKN